MGAGAHQIAGGVFHRHFGTQVAIHPFHGAIFFHAGALGNQIVNVVRPVLDGGIADAGAFAHHDFNHAAVERSLAVLRGGAALHIMNLGAFIGDDEGAFKLTD